MHVSFKLKRSVLLGFLGSILSLGLVVKKLAAVAIAVAIAIAVTVAKAIVLIKNELASNVLLIELEKNISGSANAGNGGYGYSNDLSVIGFFFLLE